jgi:hypothetical protein
MAPQHRVPSDLALGKLSSRPPANWRELLISVIDAAKGEETAQTRENRLITKVMLWLLPPFSKLTQ